MSDRQLMVGFIANRKSFLSKIIDALIKILHSSFIFLHNSLLETTILFHVKQNVQNDFTFASSGSFNGTPAFRG